MGIFRIDRETARGLLLLSLVCFLAVGGQGKGTGPARDRTSPVLIKNVPHIRQKPDFCGEACVVMMLRKMGYQQASQDDVFKASGLPAEAGRGCYTRELRTALLNLGFQIGKQKKDVWYHVKRKEAEKALTALFEDLIKDLESGVPTIVCMHYADKPKTTEHFRLILGYDRKKEEVIYHEPAVSDGAYQRMSKELFLKLWPLKYREDYWTVVKFSLKPGRINESRLTGGKDEDRKTFSDADYRKEVHRLKNKYKGKGYVFLIEKPFIVIGNESQRTVQFRAERTVRWAVSHLKESYFKHDPDRILTVYLMRDKRSYMDIASKVTGSHPDTPFGFYSSRCDALIMNISTGGGTLVHEIVHPFMEANFPDCPPWLNEGLGSLYEQSSEEDKRIVGLTNWRLAGLKKFIRKDKLPSFEDLCGYNEYQFYSQDKGSNYGQARYLCYYLQQKKLLRKFYHAFHENRESDPTGYKTLVKTLGEDDMDAFKKKWQAYVMKLTFP